MRIILRLWEDRGVRRRRRIYMPVEGLVGVLEVEYRVGEVEGEGEGGEDLEDNSIIEDFEGVDNLVEGGLIPIHINHRQ